MNTTLTNLGLTPFFTQQVSPQALADNLVMRVVEVQRTHIQVSDGDSERAITLGGIWYQQPAQHRPTVGDWVVLDEIREKVVQLLERKSVFQRMVPGSDVDVQLIAANVDTLFIVTSCNDDFKESRLERYLALALEAGVDPVIVLNKADLAQDSEVYHDRVRAMGPDLPVQLVSALDEQTLQGLLSWVTPGSTVALVGSSGVGKSTLVNALSGTTLTQTGAIRDQDGKGRHTTSYRALHRLPGGGLLLDVPGIRELEVAQKDTALPDVFVKIEALARTCKFNDCEHNQEPGCAVRAAIASKQLDARQFANYLKMASEEERRGKSLAEQHQRERQFAKNIKQSVGLKRRSPKAR